MKNTFEKNVLLLATYFPPRNNVACYRTGCFAKFLPQHGWRPTVVCEDWPVGSPDYDPEFVGTFPECVNVVRVKRPNERGLYQRFLLRKFLPYLKPHHTPFLWWNKARKHIRELFETTSFDAIWATSDPLTPMGLAEEFSKIHRIPWIADIRDSFFVQSLGSWYKRPFLAYREGRLCVSANKVITVSEGLAQGIQERTALEPSVIRNGFDPTLFPADPKVSSDKFRILYTGKLYHDPTPLILALENCIRRNLIPSNRVEFILLGVERSHFDKLCSLHPTLLHVECRKRINHREAILLQARAASLYFTVHTEAKGILTGKLFDYLGSRRPILATLDDGTTKEDNAAETIEILRKTGAGVVLKHVEDMVATLTDWY